MFQRMVVIPQEEYMQLTTLQDAKEPLTQQMKKLSSQYEVESHIADPYRKLVHHGETPDAIKEVKDKMRKQIVGAAPKPYQSRTNSLLHYLDPILKTTDRGEIFDRDDSVIADSRIEDLVQYAVRDRRRSHFVPRGWHSFLRTLRVNNIPRHMLNRDTIDALDKEVVEVKKEEGSPSGRAPKRRLKSSSPTPPTWRARSRRSPSKQRPKRERKEPAKYFDFVKI